MSEGVAWTPDKLAIIAEMAAQGRTDEAIGKRFGVKAAAIAYVRHRHGIPTKSRPGNRKGKPPAPEPVPPPEGTYKENGITYCPTRWLEGAAQGPTARPRRG